jgi:hypothetical protein
MASLAHSLGHRQLVGRDRSLLLRSFPTSPFVGRNPSRQNTHKQYKRVEDQRTDQSKNTCARSKPDALEETCGGVVSRLNRSPGALSLFTWRLNKFDFAIPYLRR